MLSIRCVHRTSDKFDQLVLFYPRHFLGLDKHIHKTADKRLIYLLISLDFTRMVLDRFAFEFACFHLFQSLFYLFSRSRFQIDWKMEWGIGKGCLKKTVNSTLFKSVWEFPFNLLQLQAIFCVNILHLILFLQIIK